MFNDYCPHVTPWKIYFKVCYIHVLKFCCIKEKHRGEEQRTSQTLLLILYYAQKYMLQISCDFDRASSLICGNKIPTRCNRGFYRRSYCLLNMFQAPLCPSSGAQEYYTVAAAYGISCCDFQVAGLV